MRRNLKLITNDSDINTEKFNWKELREEGFLLFLIMSHNNQRQIFQEAKNYYYFFLEGDCNIKVFKLSIEYEPAVQLIMRWNLL